MCNKLAAHHAWYGDYLRNFGVAGCCCPPFNLLSIWVWLIFLTECLHPAARACAPFLNPAFKISPGFGFMPVALGTVLRFCFVLTSTCLDSFHASQSLLSTKLPVQDSPVNQKEKVQSGGVRGFENGNNSQRGEEGKKTNQTSDCFEPDAL